MSKFVICVTSMYYGEEVNQFIFASCSIPLFDSTCEPRFMP
jgi:hypothetical protein